MIAFKKRVVKFAFAEYISVERFSEDDLHPDGRGRG
jgi:hypothetical protein